MSKSSLSEEADSPWKSTRRRDYILSYRTPSGDLPAAPAAPPFASSGSAVPGAPTRAHRSPPAQRPSCTR